MVGVPFGFFGMAGGFLVTPALPVLGFEPTVAVGTDLSEVGFSGGVGSFPYARAGGVDLGVVVPLLACSALGARVGSTATRVVDEAEVKGYFGATLPGGSVAVAARTAGTVYGVDALGTASVALVVGSALLVGGAVVYSGVAALREESATGTSNAD